MHVQVTKLLCVQEKFREGERDRGGELNLDKIVLGKGLFELVLLR